MLVPQSHRSVARDGATPSAPEWTNAGQTTLERWAADREAMWQSGQYASRKYLPAELATTPPPSTRTAPGRTTRPTAPSGIRAAPPRIGGRTTTAAGTTRRAMAGRGSPAAPAGPTPPITTAAGTWARAAGTGSPRGAGARRGCTGRSRRATSAGARSAGTAAPCSACSTTTAAIRRAGAIPYRAWTVIPRTSFGRAHVPGVHADRGRLVREQPAFVLQHRYARLRAAAIAVSVALQPAPQRRDQRHRSRAGARRRLDDEPAQLRPLRQRPRQPRRPRRPARHRVRRGHDVRVAV